MSVLLTVLVTGLLLFLIAVAVGVAIAEDHVGHRGHAALCLALALAESFVLWQVLL